jgi:hypothetical protein
VSTSKPASDESLSFFNNFVEVDDDVVCSIFCINSCCNSSLYFKRVTTDKKVYITLSVVLSIVNFLKKKLFSLVAKNTYSCFKRVTIDKRVYILLSVVLSFVKGDSDDSRKAISREDRRINAG